PARRRARPVRNPRPGRRRAPSASARRSAAAPRSARRRRSCAAGRCPPGRASALLDLRADPLLLLAQLGRELVAELLHLIDLADLDLRGAGHRVRAALDPLERLLERLALPDP